MVVVCERRSGKPTSHLDWGRREGEAQRFCLSECWDVGGVSTDGLHA
jgi:hypothetical protein